MEFDSDIKDHETHSRAVDFMKSVTAKEGIQYDWVWEYAKYRLEQAEKVLGIIEDKSDTIIRYLGGGTGLFTLGVLSKIDASNSHLVLFSLPAILVALVSVSFALIARKPRAIPSLPTVQEAKETYADKSKDERAAKAAFIGQWHLASEDMRIVCYEKSKWLGRATAFCFLALVLLLLPVIAAVVFPPASITTTTASTKT